MDIGTTSGFKSFATSEALSFHTSWNEPCTQLLQRGLAPKHEERLKSITCDEADEIQADDIHPDSTTGKHRWWPEHKVTRTLWSCIERSLEATLRSVLFKIMLDYRIRVGHLWVKILSLIV